MADSIYRIPNLDDKPQQEHELEAFLESANVERNTDYIDFLSGTEEKLVAPVNLERLPEYTEIAEIQDRIEAMRRTTKPVDIARYELNRVWAPLADTFAPTTNTDFERRLIDIESRIGGDMLSRGKYE